MVGRDKEVGGVQNLMRWTVRLETQGRAFDTLQGQRPSVGRIPSCLRGVSLCSVCSTDWMRPIQVIEDNPLCS